MPDPRALEKTMRGWAELLSLWKVCDNAGCARSRACRGVVTACAPKNFARLPEGVQGFACTLLARKEQGLSFDDAMEGFEGSRAEAAWRAWNAEA